MNDVPELKVTVRIIIKPSPKYACESPRLRRITNYVFILNKIFAYSTQLLSTMSIIIINDYQGRGMKGRTLWDNVEYVLKLLQRW